MRRRRISRSARLNGSGSARGGCLRSPGIAIDQAADVGGGDVAHFLQQRSQYRALVEEYPTIAGRCRERYRFLEPLDGGGGMAQRALAQRLQHVNRDEAALAFLACAALLENVEHLLPPCRDDAARAAAAHRSAIRIRDADVGGFCTSPSVRAAAEVFPSRN